MSDTKKLITPRAILSYPNLFKPVAINEGEQPKYGCSFVFTEEDQQHENFTALQRAVLAAAEERWGAKAAEMWKAGTLRSPFRRDWEAKGYPENSVFINCRSNNAPGLVDNALNIVTEAGGGAKIFYPGCIVYGNVSAYAYDRSGNKGVAFGLDNIQWLAHGERLDGRVAPQNVFSVQEGEVPSALDFSDVEGEVEQGDAVDQAQAMGAEQATNELAGLL